MFREEKLNKCQAFSIYWSMLVQSENGDHDVVDLILLSTEDNIPGWISWQRDLGEMKESASLRGGVSFT